MRSVITACYKNELIKIKPKNRVAFQHGCLATGLSLSSGLKKPRKPHPHEAPAVQKRDHCARDELGPSRCSINKTLLIAESGKGRMQRPELGPFLSSPSRSSGSCVSAFLPDAYLGSPKHATVLCRLKLPSMTPRAHPRPFSVSPAHMEPFIPGDWCP